MSSMVRIPNTETYWRTQMGQAFDEDGRVLGEAFGHDKREVFEKLMAAHANASEIRIKTITEGEHKSFQPVPDSPLRSPGAQMQMPQYRSHKDVWALKIAAVHRVLEHDAEGRDILTGADLVFVDANYAQKRVSAAYVQKHDPGPNTYYVVYADGYESCSPAKAFEEGYTRI